MKTALIPAITPGSSSWTLAKPSTCVSSRLPSSRWRIFGTFLAVDRRTGLSSSGITPHSVVSDSECPYLNRSLLLPSSARPVRSRSRGGAHTNHLLRGTNVLSLEPERIVCVYCASSRSCHPEYHQAAFRLGVVLADDGYTILYGGGGSGSMGALADGALSHRGRVVGVLPKFMADLEWGHNGLSQLELVEDMRTRKHLMLSRSHAVVALPGGSGTLEEWFEAVSLKRLGLYLNPIVLVNTRGFFDPLLQVLSLAVAERFMDERHKAMWQVVAEPEQVPGAINSAPAWSHSAREFSTQ
ncbi:MAG: TIGR00730 family Rossman fold protein [Acidobacteria bacterium]|nr:TIGR00730 family Rossman fold protein [Acidobacteriota bacterium]